MGENKKKIVSIFWDFDGVLMNSNAIRDQGFEEVLRNYPQDQVDELMVFHQNNGGLSRYVKFRHFFEKIRGEFLSDEEINKWAAKFSVIMRQLLVNQDLLIQETLEFVKKNYTKISMHIVSGSDQEELRYLCKVMGIHNYFTSINGSPKPKTKWVAEILKEYQYEPEFCFLVGDSRNDFEAAMDNQLDFVGYNDEQIEKLSTITVRFS